MSKKENLVVVPDELVMNKIYLIRNQKVMLDSDLAELYQVTTGNLNKAVNRNIKRFSEDFMFQLTETEFKNLMFQIGISSWGGKKKITLCRPVRFLASHFYKPDRSNVIVSITHNPHQLINVCFCLLLQLIHRSGCFQGYWRDLLPKRILPDVFY